MDNQNPQLQEDFLQLAAMEKALELKLAADECFRAGDDIAKAVQLYTESLQLHPVSVACLSNRAACYLLQHEAVPCIQDCSKALELLQHDGSAPMEEKQSSVAFFSVGPAPGTAKRREWVIKTLVRRGAAYRAHGKLEKGTHVSLTMALDEFGLIERHLISCFLSGGRFRRQRRARPVKPGVEGGLGAGPAAARHACGSRAPGVCSCRMKGCQECIWPRVLHRSCL